MNNYIIRIYREEKDNPRSFVGVVEEVGVEEKKAFTTYDELWAILNPRELRSGERGRRRSGECNPKG